MIKAPQKSNENAEELPLAQIMESLKIIAEKLSDIAESLDYIAATRPNGEI
ncbi:MAG: hypothetical protein ACXWTU_03800 [Methylotenera sp.]